MARLSIGEFLAKLRKEKSLTQQEVADRLDVSNRTVSAWEKDKAMPDVLLLPAIAELYGVSVDEILYGARKASEEDTPLFSPKTEKSIIRKKLSQFTMQSFILLGVSILGQIFLFLGWFNDTYTVTEKGEFNWWLFLQFVGIVAIVTVFAVLIGLWKSCESSIDSSLKESETFYLSLFQRVLIHFYIAGGASFVFGYVLLQLLQIGMLNVSMCLTYLASSAVFVIVGILMHNYQLNKLSDGVLQIKQLRSVMYCCFVSAALFALAALTACNIYFHDYLVALNRDLEYYPLGITCATAILSVAFMLTGTLMFNNKLSVSTKEDATFLSKMSFSMSVCCYIASGLYLTFALLSIIDSMWFEQNFVFLVLMFVFCVAALLLGALLHKRNLKLVWSGEEIRALFKRNGKLYLKVTLWGLIPFAVAITVITVGYLTLMPLAVVFTGVAMVPLDIVVCFVICLIKREKPSFKQ